MLKNTMNSEMTIPDILSCRGRNILVIVDGRHLHRWSCSAAGQLPNTCPDRNPATESATPETAAELKPAAFKGAMKVEKSGQTASSSGDWKEVVRREEKSARLLLSLRSHLRRRRNNSSSNRRIERSSSSGRSRRKSRGSVLSST